MEKLFFIEVLLWLAYSNAKVYSDYIEYNSTIYYFDSKTDMQTLYTIFKNNLENLCRKHNRNTEKAY